MSKKLLLAILAVYMLTHSVGCTSSSPKDEAEVAATEDDGNFAEEGEEDFAEADDSKEEEPAEEGGEEVAENAEGEEATEEAPAEEGGEEVAENADAEEGEEDLEEEVAEGEVEEGANADVAANEEDGNDEDEFPEEAPEETAVAANEEAAPTDEKVFTADNSSTTEEPAPSDSAAEENFAAASPGDSAPTEPTQAYSAPADDAPAPVYRPYLKIKDAPFESAGTLMNRVYVARKGDSMRKVSEKIYGSNRAGDLAKWNPSLSRNLKVGDKVYYNSPTQPQDSSRMLAYYEDIGVQPQVHTAQEGDNIRELGKTLLGDSNGWKELWATNLDVESKGALPPGTQLKYWPADTVAPPVMAAAPTAPAPAPEMPAAPPMDPTVANNPPPVDPMGAAPGVDPVTGQPMGQPPMDGTNVAANDPMAGSNPNDIAPPPPVAGTMGGDPGAPPPPMDAADPIKKKSPAATADVTDSNQDMTMMLGLGGVALILVAGLFMMMKRRRAASVDFSQTQV